MQIPSVLPRIFCYFCVATRYICFTRTHTHTPTNWKTPRGQHLSASVEPIQKPIDQTTEQKAVRRVQKWNEQKFAIISHIQCNKTRENGYVIYGKQTFIVDCSRVDGSRLVDAIRLTKKKPPYPIFIAVYVCIIQEKWTKHKWSIYMAVKHALQNKRLGYAGASSTYFTKISSPFFFLVFRFVRRWSCSMHSYYSESGLQSQHTRAKHIKNCFHMGQMNANIEVYYT